MQNMLANDKIESKKDEHKMNLFWWSFWSGNNAQIVATSPMVDFDHWSCNIFVFK